jgi:hypothetical protein
MTIQAGTIANVTLDGSTQITVPFPAPYGQYVASVQLTYNPPSETDYQVSAEVIGQPTVNGFVMVATGAPPGSVGNFTYIASGF